MGTFDTFVRMTRELPTTAIPRAVDTECQMLKDDLQANRLNLQQDILSILCFGEFMQMVKIGVKVHFEKPLPLDHIEFFKEVIVRLVQEKALPEEAMSQFDQAFWQAV